MTIFILNWYIGNLETTIVCLDKFFNLKWTVSRRGLVPEFDLVDFMTAVCFYLPAIEQLISKVKDNDLDDKHDEVSHGQVGDEDEGGLLGGAAFPQNGRYRQDHDYVQGALKKGKHGHGFLPLNLFRNIFGQMFRSFRDIVHRQNYGIVLA